MKGKEDWEEWMMRGYEGKNTGQRDRSLSEVEGAVKSEELRVMVVKLKTDVACNVCLKFYHHDYIAEM